VKVPETLKLPKDLKVRILNYWENRSKKNFEATYQIELPYLKYLHTKEWYEKFFQDATLFSKVKIKKITQCDENICTVGLLLNPKFSPETNIFLYDKWIKVDNLWYHKYVDSALPMGH